MTHRIISPSFLLPFIILALVVTTSAKDLAWNGYTTPGSTTPSSFTPYYVSPGTKSYDSASPLMLYSGKWTESFSSSYVQKSLRSTSEAGASVSFTFAGTGIEWFGNLDSSHGISKVYIDGVFVQNVDAWNHRRSPLKQQRIFWNFDLEFGKHTIKIINTGKRPGSQNNTFIDLDAFIVTKRMDPEQHQAQVLSARVLSNHPLLSPEARMAKQPSSQWTLVQKGSTGVQAMQLAIISSTHALIIDKLEHNPLTISGHPAWAALYNLNTHSVRPLEMQSNSFCAGGTFLGNGTLINVGGNPVVGSHTSSANFGDLDGLQAIRIFEPCDSESAEGCNISENHSHIQMASPRWYNTVIRIKDGSAMIIGGSKKGGWINNGTVNNPTIEYFPPKSIHGSKGLPIHLPFLVDTLNSNLFPIAFSLPDGKIFLAANRDAMIYDWTTNTERRLPRIPNGVRVTYPMTGTGLLLPLSPENDYTAEILLCGGSVIDDKKPGYEISSQDPSSAQCSRIILTDEGITRGWLVEQMPQPRTMLDAVLLPTGEVLIVNGAGSGISGYGNVYDQIGASNADNPVLTPVLYNPLAPAGTRFSSQGLPTSQIPRMYHSVATLTPSGTVMLTGSNPNLDRSESKYGTEYRVEWLGPPYMSMERPEITYTPTQLKFGQVAKLKVKVSGGDRIPVKVSLMDLGYVTHGFHANSRLVNLKATLIGDTLTVTGPPSNSIYPPGPGWIYVVAGGVPSEGVKVMIGSGESPPVDREALKNHLKNSPAGQSEKPKGKNVYDNLAE